MHRQAPWSMEDRRQRMQERQRQSRGQPRRRSSSALEQHNWRPARDQQLAVTSIPSLPPEQQRQTSRRTSYASSRNSAADAQQDWRIPLNPPSGAQWQPIATTYTHRGSYEQQLPERLDPQQAGGPTSNPDSAPYATDVRRDSRSSCSLSPHNPALAQPPADPSSHNMTVGTPLGHPIQPNLSIQPPALPSIAAGMQDVTLTSPSSRLSSTASSSTDSQGSVSQYDPALINGQACNCPLPLCGQVFVNSRYLRQHLINAHRMPHFELDFTPNPMPTTQWSSSSHLEMPPQALPLSSSAPHHGPPPVNVVPSTYLAPLPPPHLRPPLPYSVLNASFQRVQHPAPLGHSSSSHQALSVSYQADPSATSFAVDSTSPSTQTPRPQHRYSFSSPFPTSSSIPIVAPQPLHPHFPASSSVPSFASTSSLQPNPPEPTPEASSPPCDPRSSDSFSTPRPQTRCNSSTPSPSDSSTTPTISSEPSSGTSGVTLNAQSNDLSLTPRPRHLRGSSSPLPASSSVPPSPHHRYFPMSFSDPSFHSSSSMSTSPSGPRPETSSPSLDTTFDELSLILQSLSDEMDL